MLTHVLPYRLPQFHEKRRFQSMGRPWVDAGMPENVTNGGMYLDDSIPKTRMVRIHLEHSETGTTVVQTRCQTVESFCVHNHKTACISSLENFASSLFFPSSFLFAAALLDDVFFLLLSFCYETIFPPGRGIQSTIHPSFFPFAFRAHVYYYIVVVTTPENVVYILSLKHSASLDQRSGKKSNKHKLPVKTPMEG